MAVPSSHASAQTTLLLSRLCLSRLNTVARCLTCVLLAALSGCQSWGPSQHGFQQGQSWIKSQDASLDQAALGVSPPASHVAASSVSVQDFENQPVSTTTTLQQTQNQLHRLPQQSLPTSHSSALSHFTTADNNTKQSTKKNTSTVRNPSGNVTVRAQSPDGPMPPTTPSTGMRSPWDNSPRVAQNPVEPGYPAPQPPGEWSGAPVGGNPQSPVAPGFYDAPATTNPLNLPDNFADIDAIVQEQQTGRFMVGAGINSDAGVTGQLIYDERNFDLFAFPRSARDIWDGYAFRGGGQSFRLEAYPGNTVQRYMVSFSDPYFNGTPVSFGASAYFFDRNYFDWDEQRLGGRVSFGYRITPDISLTAAARAETINIHDPRLNTSPDLNATLGDNNLYTGQLSLTHDTRDNPFGATEGYFMELSAQQAFGTYDYPRGDLKINRYFLLRERPDGSGRHTIMMGTTMGVSGSQTPVFENYFAGGFSTLRGFDFRGASPQQGGITVGGEFMWVNTIEYMFPMTADDMIKGVVFCDFGTVEEKVQIDWDDFRVAPGFGFRVSIPRMGNGAPLAFDFAFPIMQEATDDERIFSFFMGFLR